MLIRTIDNYQVTIKSILAKVSRRIDAFKLWCWGRLESPLDSKAIKLVSTKGNQP